jgi:hypothetical protein
LRLRDQSQRVAAEWMSGKEKIEHAASDTCTLNERFSNARRKNTEIIRIEVKVQGPIQRANKKESLDSRSDRW